MTERANTPKLRFPEFNNDWTTNQAKNLFTNVSDKKHDGDLLVLSATQDKGMVPRQDLDLEIKYDKKNLSNYKRTLPNDFIISLRSFQGGFELNTIEGIVSPAYTVLRGEEELAQPKFFKQYFKSIRFIKKLDSMIYGIRDGKSISYKEFSTFSINYPSILEQQKIGDFFSKLDRQIELEEQKLEKLEEQKKGYMQKVFSQELRFKDENGDEYPEWEYNYLGNYLIPHNEKTTENNQYPVLTSSREGLFLQKDYFTRDVASKDNTGYNVVPYGFFTYRHMSDDLVFKFNINYLVPKGIVSTLYPVFSTADNLDNYFLRELLNSGVEFQKYALMQKQGGSRTYMYFNKLTNLKLHIPVLEEQKKIGNLLSKLDLLVEKQSDKVELLKERKNSFLQKMFV